MNSNATELKNTTYELFIGGLSILSIVNLLMIVVIPMTAAGQVAMIIDDFLTVIFLADFLYRLFTTSSKSGYFFRQFGWADLLASLPFPQAKLLRLFRLFRVIRLMREYGAANLMRNFVRERAGSALLTLLFLIILVLEFGGMVMVAVESRVPDANIKSAADAIWYTFVTITTVGYGDRFPVSNSGRLLGMVIMGIGVGLFGTLTGYLANVFLAPSDEGEAPATQTAVEPPTGEEPSDARARLTEIKKLLAAQQAAHDALEAKIAEVEALL